MRPLIVVALLLGGIWARPELVEASEPPLADADARQARQMIDIRLPDVDMTQRLRLADGSELYGQVQSIDDDSIVFRTIGGIVVTVSRPEIADLRVVSGRVVAGEFQQVDPHNTRLMFAPTARPLHRGEGYFGMYYILPFVQVGVTDRFSLGGGTPITYFGGGEHPFWFTPKLTVLARDKVQVATGVIHVTGVRPNAGIGYGVTTLGSADRAVTVGLGYAYSGDDRAPILMVGGDYRTGRRIKWITENWIWPGGQGFASGGIRFIGDRLSADFSLVVPLVEETFVLPLISFAWHF